MPIIPLGKRQGFVGKTRQTLPQDIKPALDMSRLTFCLVYHAMMANIKDIWRDQIFIDSYRCEFSHKSIR
jgi:hypothetical protein